MKSEETTKGDERLIFIFKVLALIALAIIAATTVYGVVATIVQGADVVGETLVTIEFPPISVFPLFYSKPVTWLSASILVVWYIMLDLNKHRVLRFSKSLRRFLKFFTFFVGSMALYEVFFNFTLWSGLIASNAVLGQLNPDLIANPFPNPETPWNIVFATKLFTVLTIISWYTFVYLQRLEQEEARGGGRLRASVGRR